MSTCGSLPIQSTGLRPCPPENTVEGTVGVWDIGAVTASYPVPTQPKWELCPYTWHKVKHASSGCCTSPGVSLVSNTVFWYSQTGSQTAAVVRRVSQEPQNCIPCSLHMWFCWVFQPVTSSGHWGGLQPSVNSQNEDQHLQVWGHGSLLRKSRLPSLVGRWAPATSKGMQVSRFTSNGKLKREVVRRFDVASAVMWVLCLTIVVKKELRQKAKLSIYQSTYVPNPTCGHELGEWPKGWDHGYKWLKWVSSIGWLGSACEIGWGARTYRGSSE